MSRFFFFSSFVTAVLAVGRIKAPSGAITVGTGQKYSTIQAAIDSLSDSSAADQSIFILPGTYMEQVTISEREAHLTIYGYTDDTSNYTSNVVTIAHNSSRANGAADDEASGTVINKAANTSFYNINIKNTYGQGSQAIALSAYGAQQGYYGVGLYGYQDTLLANVGTQLYAKSYIEGAVDFMFGQDGLVFTTKSDIRVRGSGSVTANGRSSPSDPSYYVINDCSIDKARDSEVENGTVYLGRPWREFARVAVQNTFLGSIINSAGWKVWDDSGNTTDFITYREYGNTGPGALGTRASFSHELSSPIEISSILGSNYASWVDAEYI